MNKLTTSLLDWFVKEVMEEKERFKSVPSAIWHVLRTRENGIYNDNGTFKKIQVEMSRLSAIKRRKESPANTPKTLKELTGLTRQQCTGEALAMLRKRRDHSLVD